MKNFTEHRTADQKVIAAMKQIQTNYSQIMEMIGRLNTIRVVKDSKEKALKANEAEITNWISRNDELVNRRIDQEVHRVNRLHQDSISFTDSRVDKLEQKYLDQTQSKKLING
jgi:hypothetical protein